VTPIYVDGIYVDGIYIGSLERREKVSGCVATTERRTWTSEASIWCKPEPFWYHEGMAMTLRLPAEIEDQLKQAAESEHRSVQQTVLLAIEEYLSARETEEILADPAGLRSLAEAMESERAGDVVYGVEAARALLSERKR
jgi:predicted transcriptional regulator